MFRSFFVFRSFANRFPFVRSFGSFVRSFVCVIRSFVRLRQSFVRSFGSFVRLRKLPTDSERFRTHVYVISVFYESTRTNWRTRWSFTEITERFRTIPKSRLCNFSILRKHTNELENALIVYGNSRTILMFTNIDEKRYYRFRKSTEAQTNERTNVRTNERTELNEHTNERTLLSFDIRFSCV